MDLKALNSLINGHMIVFFAMVANILLALRFGGLLPIAGVSCCVVAYVLAWQADEDDLTSRKIIVAAVIVAWLSALGMAVRL